MTQRIFRWVLTVWLLVIVWLHSHWSVAVSLTLLFIASEVETHLAGKMVACIKEIVKLLKESQ